MPKKINNKDVQAEEKLFTWQKVYPYLLIICGLIGLIASGVLMVDKVKLAADAGFHPNCNLNPIFSCTSVMKSEEANAFGFPNPIVGLAGFAVIITVGVAMLARAKFRRWFWIGLEVGTAFGLLFIHWLFYHTVYDIKALCIFCMIVWAVTIPIFFYTTIYNLRRKTFSLPASWHKFENFLYSNHIGIVILWYMVIAGLIIKHFWYFFGPK